ncbi:MAG: diguanylate cyclase [Anderseniella sp.]
MTAETRSSAVKVMTLADAPGSRDLAMQVMNTMEQGILVWSAGGVCELHNIRVFEVLEIEESMLSAGTRRDDFLAAAVARGEISQATADQTKARFNSSRPFSFDRLMPSGRVVATNARPARGGSFVVTFTDVTDARKAADDLDRARKAAEDAEARARAALVTTRARQQESRLLSELDEWLQSCKSLDELYLVVRKFMANALPGSTGELYIYSNSRDVLDGTCQWSSPDLHDHIAPDSCWALRRGRAYIHDPDRLSFTCQHVAELDGPEADVPYICVPIIAHGDTVGLMHVRLATDAGASEDLDVAASARTFAVQCGERISLAIANVKLRDELYDQSTRDPLTGLYNRRFFLDAMRRLIAQSDRTDLPFGAVYLDVDRFKNFNDTHGHDAGDVVLSRVGEALRDACVGGEMACRFGGEEFALLVPGADLATTERVAEQIRVCVADTDIRYGNTVLPHITISAGVAAFPGSGRNPRDIVKAADSALYVAKDAGRNCVRTDKPG